jgi:glycosyltransferase involved in cell wall biosynthesis
MTSMNSIKHTDVRVAAIFRHFSPVLTGAGERFRRYAPGLARRDVMLEVHTSNVSGAPPHSTDIPEIYRHDTSKNEHSEMDIAILRATLKHLESTDKSNLVIQTMSGNRQANQILAKWRERHHVPTVYVGTMVEPNPAPRGLIAKLKQRLRFHLLKCAYSHFIASSTAMADTFRSQGIKRQQISVIPSGVDTQRFRPARSKSCAKKNLGIPSEARVTLYVGNLIPRKGIDNLLAAWERLACLPAHENDLLVIVGPRDRPTFVGDQMQNDLRNFQRNLDAIIADIPDRNIRFFDHTDTIEHWYQSADLFVFPSLKEGMPNAVMEAMASGLPVASTKFIGFPETEFGTEGREFVMIDHDPKKLTSQLCTLLEDSELRTQLGANARKWVENHLDLETTLDSYAQLYRKLLIEK